MPHCLRYLEIALPLLLFLKYVRFFFFLRMPLPRLKVTPGLILKGERNVDRLGIKETIKEIQFRRLPTGEWQTV